MSVVSTASKTIQTDQLTLFTVPLKLESDRQLDLAGGTCSNRSAEEIRLEVSLRWKKVHVVGEVEGFSDQLKLGSIKAESLGQPHIKLPRGWPPLKAGSSGLPVGTTPGASSASDAARRFSSGRSSSVLEG